MFVSAALGLALSLAAAPEGRPAAGPVEVARIQAHLDGALERLRARDIRALSPETRARRAELIEVLEAYRDRGRFPRNLDFPGEQIPYFVDAAGTRCAVAELVHHTGGGELVEAVARTANHARVAELAGNPSFSAWLERHGLTAEEAARIQPSYCASRGASLCSTPGDTVEAVFEARRSGEGGRDRVVYTPDAAHLGALPDEPLSLYLGEEAEIPERVVFVRRARRNTILVLRSGGRFGLLGDADCAAAPTLRLDVLLAAVTAPDCVERAEAAHFGWASARCSNDAEDAICSVDAGPLPSFPDTGPAADAGPTADAGPASPGELPAETGCRASGAPTLFALLGLVALFRRRLVGGDPSTRRPSG